MKEELQGKLVEILTSIQTAAGKASDFAMEQLPDIAQSYVVYGRIVETIQLAVLVGLFGAALFVAIRYGFANKEAVETEGYLMKGDWKAHRVMAAMLGSFCSMLMGVLATLQVSPFALVWFAPKVWLLKQLASFLK